MPYCLLVLNKDSYKFGKTNSKTESNVYQLDWTQHMTILAVQFSILFVITVVVKNT